MSNKRTSNSAGLSAASTHSHRSTITSSGASAATRSSSSTNAANSAQTPVAQTASQVSSRILTTAPANERSNEVPPSSNSSNNNASASTSSASSSNQNAAEPTSSASTQSNFESDEASSSVVTSANSNEIGDINLMNKKSSDSLFLQRIKKRPISGVLSSDADAELQWFLNFLLDGLNFLLLIIKLVISPICFDLIDVAHVTKCGHSFCQSCIQTALEHTHRCPKCNTPCSINKDVFPNFTCKFFFNFS